MMSDEVSGGAKGGFLGRLTANQGRAWMAGTGLLAIGLVAGGYLMGDGLVRMKQADRAVTVRGLAERDVTADLATWTIAYSAKAGDLQSAQAKVDNDTKAIGAFFNALGFDADALQPTGANVSQFNENGVPTYTVKQRLSLRTTDIKKAEAAVKRQFDLVKSGVELEEGSGMAFTFTKLNAIKPEMNRAGDQGRAQVRRTVREGLRYRRRQHKIGNAGLFRGHRARWRQQRRLGCVRQPIQEGARGHDG